MKRIVLAALASAAALFCSSALPYAVTAVGDNPFGIPNSGTGAFKCLAATPPSCTVSKDFTSVGLMPIIIGPQGQASSGVDILHITENVTNSTGVPWTDFHFRLLFIDNNSSLTVQYLNVVNSTGEFSTINPVTDGLDLFGLVPAGGTFNLSFDLQISSQVGSFDLFALLETPTVNASAPGTLALLALGLAGLGARRRGRV